MPNTCTLRGKRDRRRELEASLRRFLDTVSQPDQPTREPAATTDRS